MKELTELVKLQRLSKRRVRDNAWRAVCAVQQREDRLQRMRDHGSELSWPPASALSPTTLFDINLYLHQFLNCLVFHHTT